jgi:DNA-binding XRE family transcriptional regulator
MFDREKFAAVCRDSGLTKAEVGVILGVTRQTVYDWLKGGEPFQPFLQRLAVRACDALLIAIKQGVLPLSRNLPRDERDKKVALMATKVQQLPPTQRL